MIIEECVSLHEAMEDISQADKICDIINRPYYNVEGNYSKPVLKLSLGWVTALRIKPWRYIHLHALTWVIHF